MGLPFLQTVKNPLIRYLDTVGDGTGLKHATGDYSTIEQAFKAAPMVGLKYRIVRFTLFICDSPNPLPNDYGSMPTLTNGLLIYHRNEQGIFTDFTDGIPIKSNLHWQRFCNTAVASNYEVIDNTVLGRWTLFNTASPLMIDGNNGEWFEVLLRDDFSPLTDHLFQVIGSIE